MIGWIESQHVAAIAVAVYAACMVLASLVCALVLLLSRTRLAEDLHHVTPSLLTPLGVILGLLLVFLSSRVWTNVDRASAYAAEEASALRELLRIADDLPDGVGTSIRAGVTAYRDWVLAEDWPRMLAGKGSLPVPLPGLRETTRAVVTYNAVETGQRSLQQEALASVQKVRDARRGRILLSKTFIGTGQWAVVILLYTHVLFVIGIVQSRRRGGMLIGVFSFASGFAICLALLLVYDRPFHNGGLTVEPVGLQQLSLD